MSDLYYSPRKGKELALWSKVSEDEWNTPQWQLRNTIRSIDKLKQIVKLNTKQVRYLEESIKQLEAQGKDPLRVTPYYASLMQEDVFFPEFLEQEDAQNRLDPIFWQSVPTPANLMFPNTGIEGAMAETSRSYGSVYQRYPNRVALLVAGNTSCASYCTHCQRTKSLDAASSISSTDIQKGLFYIAKNTNIDEVLVTGGDALMISPAKLAFILESLGKIEHLRLIRIATRVPVVLPMAVTDEFLATIAKSVNRYNNGPDKYVYFMTHLNHYHEITEEFAKSVKRIRQHGFSVRNQTVLLNHVNNNYRTLAETFRRMLWAGVEPYYLLQCHKEKGLVHFITPLEQGVQLIKNLQGWISGMARPVYAANLTGGGGKVLLMPSGHGQLNSGMFSLPIGNQHNGTMTTWDDRIIDNYEALGRASGGEYDEACRVMNEFIGRDGVFKPCLNIFDEAGDFVETTNLDMNTKMDNHSKTSLLDYIAYQEDMPLTNPKLITAELDAEFYAQAGGQIE
jgi:lysine 2,3-aminomutase